MVVEREPIGVWVYQTKEELGWRLHIVSLAFPDFFTFLPLGDQAACTDLVDGILREEKRKLGSPS